MPNEPHKPRTSQDRHTGTAINRETKSYNRVKSSAFLLNRLKELGYAEFAENLQLTPVEPSRDLLLKIENGARELFDSSSEGNRASALLMQFHDMGIRTYTVEQIPIDTEVNVAKGARDLRVLFFLFTQDRVGKKDDLREKEAAEADKIAETFNTKHAVKTSFGKEEYAPYRDFIKFVISNLKKLKVGQKTEIVATLIKFVQYLIEGESLGIEKAEAKDQVVVGYIEDLVVNYVFKKLGQAGDRNIADFILAKRYLETNDQAEQERINSRR